MKSIGYVISDAEYAARWKSVQRTMEQHGCDLLFVYGDDRSFVGPGNVRYLSDYAPHFEPVLIIMPATGTPVMVTGPECKDYARLHSRIKDIFSVTEFALAGQEYPFTDMTNVKRVVSEHVGSDINRLRTIGVCGMDVIPFELYEALKSCFRKSAFVNAGAWLTEVRMVKSPAEIAIIRRAYEIADAGMRAGIKAIREGVAEYEIAAETEYVMRRMGAERSSIDSVVGSGPNSRPIITRAHDRKVRKGDLIVFSTGPRFQGYHAALGRPIFVGKTVPADLQHAVKIAAEALEKTRRALKPGAIGNAVEAAGRDHVKKGGLGDYYVYSSCHSVGTVEAEEPILGPKSRLKVQANMVFNIDIPLFLAPFGGFRLEDGFLVTRAGNERLNRLETKLFLA